MSTSEAHCNESSANSGRDGAQNRTLEPSSRVIYDLLYSDILADLVSLSLLLSSDILVNSLPVCGARCPVLPCIV